MASVWTNQECTERPTVGQTYTTVYVKLHKAFGVDESIEFGTGGPDGRRLTISTPTTEVPDDPYYLLLWADFSSEDGDSPYEVDQVVTVTANPGVEVSSEFVVDFYEE